MNVSTVNEMRQMDAASINTYGISGEILMENAALAAYQALAGHISIDGKRILVFCGSGNNGGDGLAVARHIHSNRGKPHIYLLGDADAYHDAARLNYDITCRLGLEMQRLHPSGLTEDQQVSLRMDLAHCDAVVDAIFGTGLTRPVEGVFSQVIEMINASARPILSIDIPSGVQGDTGQVLGCAVQATWTATFGLPKAGNLLYPGHQHCGELTVSHISFPPALYRSESIKIATNEPLKLSPRKTDGHKGSFGQALFIAGAAGYLGAPYFAAISFLKAGGGYSRLAAPRSITPFIAMKGSEIVFIPQKETLSGSLAVSNKNSLLELAEKMDIVILGCGLSLEAETQQLVRELAAEINRPLLIDGDGITAICQNLDLVRQRKARTVLTPHLGEMARLTHLGIDEISANPVAILQQTAADLRSIIVLKGAHSLVGTPDGRVFINLTGNSGMATAGSGDVLAGTIAAMPCLGLDLPEAVRMGVYTHGLAGDLAAADKGEDGITAQDILEHLPFALLKIRKSES
jgi:ADP-dependent NAD(P)H-hydrate dehydratase / NAD(P)H-hydrate epimerase